MCLCLCACEDDPGSSSLSVMDPDAPYSLTEQVHYTDPVPFPDKNLEKALREAMKLPEKYEITPLHCSGLSYLDLRGKGITNLDGLQYCTGLEVLYAGDNEIVHLDALEGLIDLFILDLSNNNVRDVAPILKLSNLMLIDLYGNPVEDILSVQKAFDIDKTYISFEYSPVAWE